MSGMTFPEADAAVRTLACPRCRRGAGEACWGRWLRRNRIFVHRARFYAALHAGVIATEEPS